ncbi:uncharacterized protein K452DRAFT_342038 [Aplosporella prunicola CBS 121167]|uniref:Uncharacterized protein n=1 Tax=Aplosporella prunicola CBS 121167 TaxID=1176127 RepID=A0A6A6AXX7_9PEZI|nr:uncharacterized protein K452DRAFT_344986 [Aplosporella prunicola CBS 121167]XP_033392507.1 uncharacterized protein K452DRAFT_342038 [Aplosporella prunicola CBS 121167]KAF2136136.1 hypothetical protein K452DRAFT_344986 [Aplosporella prunicola CBS 121167]KAF2136789.1 hypothetical protein K452DRAFT_342038 [Aplosporella prunicola CBS 121167]
MPKPDTSASEKPVSEPLPAVVRWKVLKFYPGYNTRLHNVWSVLDAAIAKGIIEATSVTKYKYTLHEQIPKGLCSSWPFEMAVQRVWLPGKAVWYKCYPLQITKEWLVRVDYFGEYPAPHGETTATVKKIDKGSSLEFFKFSVKTGLFSEIEEGDESIKRIQQDLSQTPIRALIKSTVYHRGICDLDYYETFKSDLEWLDWEKTKYAEYKKREYEKKLPRRSLITSSNTGKTDPKATKDKDTLPNDVSGPPRAPAPSPPDESHSEELPAEKGPTSGDQAASIDQSASDEQPVPELQPHPEGQPPPEGQPAPKEQPAFLRKLKFPIKAAPMRKPASIRQPSPRRQPISKGQPLPEQPPSPESSCSGRHCT